MEKNSVKIALLGLGTVGFGVYKVLQMQKDEMIQKLGKEIEIGKILVRNKEKAAAKIQDASILTTSFDEIRNDPEIQVVVEVMGGVEPAKTYILEALRSGKDVVTANKDLLAVYGKQLLETAEENHVKLMFEASVAGGIPIIQPLKQCLIANNISAVMGIVNGTTNYILSKMTSEGWEFDQALARATELGYAEADPTADIEGYDAGRKMAILASLAFHSRVTFDDVYMEGITKISATDIRYAKEMGCIIKLLGIARNTPDGIEVRVHPTLIPEDHALASVSGSYNAVFVIGDAVQDAMFYGRGAGELPTASAVCGDLFECVRDRIIGITNNNNTVCSCYKNLPVKKIDEIESRYFIRMEVEDRSGVLASVASVLGNNDVSIAQVIQKAKRQDHAEIVVITDKVKEKYLNDSLAIFNGMSYIHKISSLIRVYD